MRDVDDMVTLLPMRAPVALYMSIAMIISVLGIMTFHSITTMKWVDIIVMYHSISIISFNTASSYIPMIKWYTDDIHISYNNLIRDFSGNTYC